MGGSPAERCRSEARFLTANAKSSAMSIYNPIGPKRGPRVFLRPAAAASPERRRRRGRSTCGLQREARYAGAIIRPIMSPDEKAWQAVRSRIAVAARRASRDPAAVELLAVSKAQPAAKVRAAYTLGQRAFGENYVQEASLKSGQLSDL